MAQFYTEIVKMTMNMVFVFYLILKSKFILVISKVDKHHRRAWGQKENLLEMSFIFFIYLLFQRLGHIHLNLKLGFIFLLFAISFSETHGLTI